MSKILKDYQIRAIEEIQELFDIYIKRDRKEIVFKAPTGSGKTFIVTKLLEKISLENEEEKIAFIWASIGKGDLHKQSYDSVKRELEGYPECKLLDESFVSSNTHINDKEILFVNWEKLIQKNRGTDTWKNSLMKDQEGRNFIDLIEETKKQGIKICLIVDESHIGLSKDTSISMFRDEIISPTVTIEMSATPKIKADVEVTLEEAIEEGMVKEQLIINKDISLNSIDGNDDQDSMNIVLEKAEKQRRLIVDEYKKLNIEINPLVLVQVPNTVLGDDAIRVVREYLEKHNITEDNGKLAIWLDGYKYFDSEKIKEKNNEIEYLIFKTVVDTGWDCPRSHMLVKFRDVHSNTSKIQTIGRILRTPEGKKYNNKILDNGYIFTNMEYIDPRNEEYSPNRTKDISVTVKLGWDKTLPKGFDSFYKSRVSSYNSADTRIYELIEESFREFFDIDEGEYFVDEKLTNKGVILDGLDTSLIIGETTTEISDWQKEERIGGGIFSRSIKSSEIEIRGKYETIIAANLNGLAKVRSISPIKQGMAKAVQRYVTGIPRDKLMYYTQLLVVKNEELFSQIISDSTDKFKNKYPDANMDGKYDEYEISDIAYYSSETYKEIRSNLSLYSQMYVLKDGSSNLEERFLQELDSRYEHRIEWVWHNGSEPTIENFGVMIKKDSPAFRPDFIIKFEDGRIGIFDTKGIDYMVEDTTEKAIALQIYIEEKQNQGLNIFGGIVVEYQNEFYLNKNKDYKDFNLDKSQWKRILFEF
ncbi:MAG TPA: DEAD/DEAH box helicase family protein [Gallicola sp.]|nr:DEAD/DEAH box helicase family protein [Gallicola sp.]